MRLENGTEVPLDPSHAELPGLQGGQPGEYYHLTLTQRNKVDFLDVTHEVDLDLIYDLVYAIWSFGIVGGSDWITGIGDWILDPVSAGLGEFTPSAATAGATTSITMSQTDSGAFERWMFLDNMGKGDRIQIERDNGSIDTSFLLTGTPVYNTVPGTYTIPVSFGGGYSGSWGAGDTWAVTVHHVGLRNYLNAPAPPDPLLDDVTKRYTVGSRWFDIVAKEEWVCLDATDGAAIWKKTTDTGGGPGTTDHALLTNLQGGTTGQYYHLTAAEHAAVLAGSGHGSGSVGQHGDVDLTVAPQTGEGLIWGTTSFAPTPMYTAAQTDALLLGAGADVQKAGAVGSWVFTNTNPPSAGQMYANNSARASTTLLRFHAPQSGDDIHTLLSSIALGTTIVLGSAQTAGSRNTYRITGVSNDATTVTYNVASTGTISGGWAAQPAWVVRFEPTSSNGGALAQYNAVAGDTTPSTGQVGLIFSGGTAFTNVTDLYFGGNDAAGVAFNVWLNAREGDIVTLRVNGNRTLIGQYVIGIPVDTGPYMRLPVDSVYAAFGSPGTSLLDVWYTAVGGSAGPGTTDHALLSNLQGGQAGEYYHLTAAEHSAVLAGSGHGAGSVDQHGDVTKVGAAEGMALFFDAGLDLAPSWFPTSPFAEFGYTGGTVDDGIIGLTKGGAAYSSITQIRVPDAETGLNMGGIWGALVPGDRLVVRNEQTQGQARFNGAVLLITGASIETVPVDHVLFDVTVEAGSNGDVGVFLELWPVQTSVIAHAASHAAGQSDPLTLSQSQITGLTGALTGKQDTSAKNQPNGYAGLDVLGRIPSSQLPISALEFKGGWNASTNTPNLNLPYAGTAGDTYSVTVAGTRDLGGGSKAYATGDRLLYDGSGWVHEENTDEVGALGDVFYATHTSADHPQIATAQAAADAAQSDIDDHLLDLANPHQVSAADVGLGNVPDYDWTAPGIEQVHASRYSSGTGGATNTVQNGGPAGGVENTGDNVNAVLQLISQAEATVLGRAIGAGAGRPVALNQAEIQAIVGAASVPDASTTVKGKVELATDGESAPDVVVQGNDSRLSNPRTPLAHDIGSAAHIGTLTDALHGTRGGGTQHAAATTSVAGFLSATDKVRIDAMADNATNTPLSATAPVSVTKATASAGVATQAARQDHKHDVSTAAPSGTAVQIGNTASEGSATTLARSDHSHTVAAGTPVNVTKAANSAGAATTFARSDHKHDVTTATAGTITVGAAAAEGSATSLSRSDHTHALTAPAAPADVTRAAASAGVATTVARSDHKHDVATATAVELTDATNGAGSGSSLALANHTHAHGNRGGGTLHAAAVAGVSSGFMTGAMATQLAATDAAGTARPPTAHAASHGSGQSDPLTLSQSQITGLTGALTGKQDTSAKNQPSGYAGLDVSGKILASQLPVSVMEFKGGWNANTNTPDINAGAKDQGDIWVVTVAGTTNLSGITDWGVGDHALYDGSAWVKVDNSDSVGAQGDLFATNHPAAGHTAVQISFAPAGTGLSATEVQAAIAEVAGAMGGPHGLGSSSHTASPISDIQLKVTDAELVHLGSTESVTADNVVAGFDGSSRVKDSGVAVGSLATAAVAIVADRIVIGDDGAKGLKDSGLALTDVEDAIALAGSAVQPGDLGTSAYLPTGLAIGNVLTVADVGFGVPGMPAIDGNLLTGVRSVYLRTSLGGSVNVGGSAAPTTGQVLRATGPTAATWQTITVGTPGDNSVGLAQLAPQARSSLYTFDAATDPILLAPGAAGTILTSQGTGAPLLYRAAGTGITVNALDISTNDGEIDHDNLLNFELDAHTLIHQGTYVDPSTLNTTFPPIDHSQEFFFGENDRVLRHCNGSSWDIVGIPVDDVTLEASGGNVHIKAVPIGKMDVTGGTAGQAQRVNTGGTAMEWFDPATVGGGSGASTIKGINVPDPAASTIYTLFKTDQELTVTEIEALIVGTAPSLAWTLEFGTTRGTTVNTVGGATTSNAGTQGTTTISTPTTPVIPANNWVWLRTAAKTGTVTEFTLTFTHEAVSGTGATQLNELSDVTGTTGTGTVVVMQGSPSITTPTLDTPAIASFASAGHTHQNAAGGGTLAPTALAAQANSGLLVYGASGAPQFLGSGTSGYTLQSTGPGTAPTWASSAGGGGYGAASEIGAFTLVTGATVAAGQFINGNTVAASVTGLMIDDTNLAGVNMTPMFTRLLAIGHTIRVENASDPSQYHLYRLNSALPEWTAGAGGYQASVVSMGGTLSTFINGSSYRILYAALGGTYRFSHEHTFTVDFTAVLTAGNTTGYLTFPINQGYSAHDYSRNIGVAAGLSTAFTNWDMGWTPPAAGRLLNIHCRARGDGVTGTAFGGIEWRPYSLTHPASFSTTAPTAVQLQEVGVTLNPTVVSDKVMREASANMASIAMQPAGNGSTPNAIVNVFRRNAAGSPEFAQINLRYDYIIGG